MLTLAAFALALGFLITVHEYGHYRMAVACGVKVLRFSIGFGPALYSWKIKGSSTEFVIGAVPLGGFVKMLDEREAAVPPTQRHHAFNCRPLYARFAIVAAGPLANLMLAVLLYAVVNWSGVVMPAPMLAAPEPGSVAAQAGLVGGERAVRAGFGDLELDDLQSYDDVHWLLTRAILEKRDLLLEISGPALKQSRMIRLRLGELESTEPERELFRRIGLVGPFTRPLLGDIKVGAAADRAGLRKGDLVRQVGTVSVSDGQQLRRLIRGAVTGVQSSALPWKIDRAGVELVLNVQPERQIEGGIWIGRIGAYVGSVPEMVTVRYGPIHGLWLAVVRCWDVSALTVRMMGKMLLGEASLKNLSGPLTIADYAGKSANSGLTQYVLFLALISVSLGVLNLLPIPVLDGGHLMYYLWEWITGKPVSDKSLDRLQRGGFAILLVLMSIAIFNDINRLLG